MDDSYYTLPDGGGTSFSKADWARAARARKKQREKLAKTCKHLVKSSEEPKPRKANREQIKAERARLEQKEQDAEREADGFE